MEVTVPRFRTGDSGFTSGGKFTPASVAEAEDCFLCRIVRFFAVLQDYRSPEMQWRTHAKAFADPNSRISDIDDFSRSYRNGREALWTVTKQMRIDSGKQGMRTVTQESIARQCQR
jgi:hypothetical protein